jgi:hypothetical protein
MTSGPLIPKILCRPYLISYDIAVKRHKISKSESDDTLFLEGFEKRIYMDVSDPENFRAMDIPKDIYRVLKEHSA